MLTRGNVRLREGRLHLKGNLHLQDEYLRLQQQIKPRTEESAAKRSEISAMEKLR